MPLRLSLPTIQKWSCHSCSDCCRQNVIVVSAEEQKRIQSQNWSQQDGVAGKIFVPMGSSVRLATKEDGSCVFLDDKGLCKIHGKFGEAAKPLVCRVYPFAFHPAGDELALSLRFCCPSVVANQGQPMDKQVGSLNSMRDLVVPTGVDKLPPPTISGKLFLTWEETLIIVEAFAQLFAHQELSLDQKLLQADFIARMLDMADFDKIRGDRIAELLQVLFNNAPAEIAQESGDGESVPKLVMTQFRLIVAQYARHDSFAAASTGMGYRMKMLFAGLKMSRGRGMTPAMQSQLPAVAFARIVEPMKYASLTDQQQSAELWSRYFEVKLRGMHFAGRGCFNLPLIEGLQRLLLMYPVTMYIARWIAAANKESQLKIEHVKKALSITDHHHGYSPAMAKANFRSMARYIFQQKALPGLFRLLAADVNP